MPDQPRNARPGQRARAKALDARGMRMAHWVFIHPQRQLMMKSLASHGGALWCSFVAGLLLCAAAAAADANIVYPLTGSRLDSRYDYDWAVLRLALDKTRARYGSYDLHQSPIIMSPQRITQELQNRPGRINILARATDPELEKTFLPVRIPIDKGLLGYRIFLVRAADLPRFAAVRTLRDLQPMTAGQGKGWADIPILHAAGLSTVEGSTYEGLFAMLEAKRFDFFSRAADEATREYNERHTLNPTLAVEPTLMLHYPLPRYFFLRRDAEGRELAARITAGLEIMVRDGSLNELFYRYKNAIIEQADLKHRRVINIANPDLSPETPLSRSELWYDPLAGNPSGGK